MRFISNRKGQSLIEYMVIVALMAIASMGVMRVLSQTTSARLANIAQTLQGGKKKVRIQVEKIEQDDVRKKDMSNFFQGSQNSKAR